MNNEEGGPKRYASHYFTNRDGLSIHYRDYPGDSSRPPLLCLPGLTRNARDFAELADRYSPRFRVIAPDFRGRGLSEYDPDASRYTAPTYAHDMIELLDQLGIERAIFVGTSLGGIVTMLLAVVAPQRIAASVLNDVGPELDLSGIDRIRTYVGKDVRFASWDEAADVIEANLRGTFDGYTHEDWVRLAKRNCREDNGEICFDYDMAIAQPFDSANSEEAPPFDMWPLFNALAQKPLLVVRGGKSDLLTAQAAEKMQAAAPNMKLVTVPCVGHAPELSEREAVAGIDAFLESVAL